MEEPARIGVEWISEEMGLHGLKYSSISKILADHDNIEEKPIEYAIKEAGELLYHMQIGENDRGIPGTGSIRWDGIANGIKKIGYDRWLVIETFPPWYEGVRACLWCQLAPDQDEIAGGELQFLRRSFGSGV